MTSATKAAFVISSGHSGDSALASLLSGFADVELHENYVAQIHQPLGVHRYMRLVDDEICRGMLIETCGSAIHYCEKPLWLDCTSHLAWLISPLSQLLPESRFVHLVRDGRKVVGTYIREHRADCYSDRTTSILQHHYDRPENYPAPPPEAKYWWPLPFRDHLIADRFRLFSQAERVGWYWAESNRVIARSLSKLDQSRYIRVHLEDLLTSPLELRRLIEFLGLPYSDDLFSSLAHSANALHQHTLSPDEARAVKSVVWEMMELLGYAGVKEPVTSA